MHVKTFRSVRKPSRSRPLLRPQPNTRKNPFVAPYKFAEEPSMTLRVNLSRVDFHAWDRCFLDPALRPVRGHKFAGVHPSLRNLLRKRRTAIIASGQRAAGARINALPKIFFALGHSTLLVMSSEVEASRCDAAGHFHGIPRLRYASLGMTFQLSCSEKSARSRERFGL